jgi:hypothetical protein
LVLAANCDWEGDTFRVSLVNDTEAQLKFLQCDVDCDTLHERLDADPGESHGANGTVDVASLWQVQDEMGHVLGCFRIDFDERPGPESDALYASRDLVACVR